MNFKLRKLHLKFWIVIIIVVPIVVGISIFNRPAVELNNSTKSSLVTVFPTIVKEFETENLKINIRGDKTLKHQLEIFIKTPLKSASTGVFYLVNNQKGNFIGAIESKGVYRFNLEENLDGIVLYDAIKNELIKKIKL